MPKKLKAELKEFLPTEVRWEKAEDSVRRWRDAVAPCSDRRFVASLFFLGGRGGGLERADGFWRDRENERREDQLPSFVVFFPLFLKLTHTSTPLQ